MHAREAITSPVIEATTFESLEMFARSQVQEVGELLGLVTLSPRVGPLGAVVPGYNTPWRSHAQESILGRADHRDLEGG
jgi:hypothetical protein